MNIIRTIYMNPSWGTIQEVKEEGKAETFCFECSEGKIVYPFIRRKAGVINGIEYYDTVTPRGKCGPVAMEENDVNLYSEFNKAFQNYCNETGIVAEYINFDPWNTEYDKFRDIYNLSYHGSEFCHSLDGDFFMRDYSQKRRNAIRRAVKSGIEIETDASWAKIDDFLELYKYTVQKHDVSRYYMLDRSFLDAYREKLGEKAKLGFARYEGKNIACGIFLDGGDVFHYHFSASNPEYSSLNAMSLLLYREAEEASQNGCRIMDLGSASVGSSLEIFKKTMCSEESILPTYVGTAVRNQKIYDMLIETNGRGKEGYFPAYKRQ